MSSLIVIAASLALGLGLTLFLMRQKPGERVPMGHPQHTTERRLGGAYVSRDDLFKAIGADYPRAVLLDGAVIHSGALPPEMFTTNPKGGLVNPHAALVMDRRLPQAAPGQPAAGQGKPCGGCGGRHPGQRPPAAPELRPGAQELHSGFVAAGSPAAPVPAGSSAPASTRPAPPAAAHSGQAGASPQ